MSRYIVPTHWSPEQALAVYEHLQRLSELVWAHYHRVIIDLVGPTEVLPPSLPPVHPQQLDLFDSDPLDFDDNLPF
jgi:hypothetical protein